MLLRRAGVIIATCAPFGYSPVAPGTVGSGVGLAVFYGVRQLNASAAIELVILLLLIAIGIWSATEAERHFGGIDPGQVVIDEVIGMLITLAFIPVGLAGAVVGFFVFRVLDIVKPWPARRLERLPGGMGIVFDDVMAGIYGNIVMWVLVALAPTWLR